MVALAAHPAPAYGGYGPHYKCRDTNTSVYAEVCVPAFAQEVTPQVLDVKVVVDNDYCYNQIRTVCELTTQTVSREICTYTYVSEKSVQPAQTTQVSVMFINSKIQPQSNVKYTKRIRKDFGYLWENEI